MTFNRKDSTQIKERGSSVAAVSEQIDRFKKGFPRIGIVGPATPERGICVLDEASADEAVEYSRKAAVNGRCKFVPASGAASRMFKDIYSGMNRERAGEDVAPGEPLAVLAREIERFAFYDESVFGPAGESPECRLRVAEALLTDKGLDYGSKPKGVLKFHRYDSGEVRTALAEHLVEAARYMRNEDGTARLVITISPEHRALFEAAVAEVVPEYEERYQVHYDITFTCQDKATDTIAVDPSNKPFRQDDGSLLFRPAGHGALIRNLNEVDAELVSIKNIDNVSCERYLPVTARWKEVLMGKALMLRDKIFGFLEALDSAGDPSSPACRRLCDQIESFLDKELCIQVPLTSRPEERAALLRSKLDRPIRVCGMVRNEGEPGGGPFITVSSDGSTSLQILESVQIDSSDPGAASSLARATHFNPVDLVCILRGYKGAKFDLEKYVDPETGFISSKSYQGRELKALELPGLWNGAMSDWNTLFVEVPIDTFNPVKTVLDLLRPAHE